MSNHLVIIEQQNNEPIIQVMTREEIMDHGKKGLFLIEGNFLKAFSQIMDVNKLARRTYGHQTSYNFKKRSEHAKR
jgi:hypothetical protein